MKDGVSKEYLDGTRRWNPPRLPIDRFLHSRIGKHWSKIYQEMSQAFDKRTNVGRSFFRSLKWYVEKNCYIVDKRVYSRKSDTIVNGFYVHPKSGCLQLSKPPAQEKPVEPLKFIKLDAKKAYSKEDGIWYLVTYKKNEYYRPNLGSIYNPLTEYEKELYCREYSTLGKKQLNSKELREAGLANDSSD